MPYQKSQPKPPLGKNPSHPKTILVAATSKLFSDLYKTVFEMSGFKVICALSEEEMISVLPADNFCLVIMELGISRERYRELIAGLQTKRIPVLVLVAGDDATKMKQLVKEGTCDYADIYCDNLEDILERARRLIENRDQS